MQAYLSLDVGGTQIKSCLVSTQGEILSDVLYYPSYSNQSKQEILGNFSIVIQSGFHIAKKLDINIIAVGVGFPGPFDYSNGISKIQGIGKYDSIYDVNLKEIFEQEFKCNFYFANDADLYTLGECFLSKGKNYNRVMCICIGTGLGSGFFSRPNLVKGEYPVPKTGWIYNERFMDGIIDQYISATGIYTMMKQNEVTKNVATVLELSQLASNGDTNAIAIFDEFSERLTKAILPYAVAFKADCVIVGGQVSNSAPLFIDGLKTKLMQHNIVLQISENSANLSMRAIIKIIPAQLALNEIGEKQ
ncbi:MAG: ROK family protein [Oscillospiraceae bacterium]